MLIRLTLNGLVHAAAGVAVGGLAIAAAEGWRRALRNQEPARQTPTDMPPPESSHEPAAQTPGPTDG
jgi:hypothetical protein